MYVLRESQGGTLEPGCDHTFGESRLTWCVLASPRPSFTAGARRQFRKGVPKRCRRSDGTGSIVFRFAVRAACPGDPVKLVKVSRLITIARLWWPRGRLPPALLFATRKDPRLLRDTAAIASGAAVLSVDHEQKKFSGILRKCACGSHAVRAEIFAEIRPALPSHDQPEK